MANIWQLTINKKECIFIKISLKFVFNDLVHNELALAEVMAWCHQSGHKPSSKTITLFIDVNPYPDW